MEVRVIWHAFCLKLKAKQQGEEAMKNQELEREVARLESINDQLVTEMELLDRLLKRSGFAHGIASLREVALEMIEYPDRNPEEE